MLICLLSTQIMENAASNPGRGRRKPRNVMNLPPYITQRVQSLHGAQGRNGRPPKAPLQVGAGDRSLCHSAVDRVWLRG